MNNNKNLLLSTLTLLFIIGIFTFVSPAHAANIPLPSVSSLPTVSIDSVVQYVIRVLFAVGQIGFIIVLLVGGVTFITASGDESKVEKAKKLILYAVIGIVIMFAAWGIAQFITTSIGGGGTGGNGGIITSIPSTGTSVSPSTNTSTSTNPTTAQTTTSQQCLDDCYVSYVNDFSGCPTGSAGDGCRTTVTADYNSCKKTCTK